MQPAQTDASLVGTTVGNYEVSRRLGAGAMGEVYLGVHPAIGRQVAIKTVMASLAADPEITERFLSEARAVSRINHPGIIQIFDFGTLPDGRLYYVMEFLEGQELSALLKERAPLAPAAAAELLRQITSAMEAAHDAGIVHRDLKPDNIFVGGTADEPVVRVLDFGIAKLLNPTLGGESRTATGMIMGTPMYMAPEQAAGQVRDISPATDIYALGVILYEMLTGRCPFVGTTTAVVLSKHLTEPPPPLSRFVLGSSPALEACLQRALAKAPADRHPSMQALFDEFADAVSGGSEALQPTLAASPDLPAAGLATDETMAADGDLPAGGRAAQPDTTLGSAAVEATPPAAPTARKRRLLLIAASLALLGSAGITYYLLSRGKPPPQRAAQPPVTAGPAAEDAAVPRRAAPPPTPPRTTVPRPAVRRVRVKSQLRRLKVRITVPGAPAYTDRTPLTVEARDGDVVLLQASRPGYQPFTQRVRVQGDLTVTLNLVRRGTRRRATRSPAMAVVVMRPDPPAMRPPPPDRAPPMRTKEYKESTISPYEK